MEESKGRERGKRGSHHISRATKSQATKQQRSFIYKRKEGDTRDSSAKLRKNEAIKTGDTRRVGEQVPIELAKTKLQRQQQRYSIDMAMNIYI